MDVAFDIRLHIRILKGKVRAFRGAVFQTKALRVPEGIAQGETAVRGFNAPGFLKGGFAVSRAGENAVLYQSVLQMI